VAPVTTGANGRALDEMMACVDSATLLGDAQPEVVDMQVIA